MLDKNDNVGVFKSEPIWRPSSSSSNMSHFMSLANLRYEMKMSTYKDLHDWSVSCPDQFWLLWWEVGEFLCSLPPKEIIGPHGCIGDRPKWFVGARLNFAENLLRFQDERMAIICTGEGDQSPVQQTYCQLFDSCQRWAAALRAAGVKEGTRVAAYLPNGAEAIQAMLGAATLGAVWCAASPDFGVKGVLDRFSQVQPLVLVAIESVRYNDKVYSQLDKVQSIAEALPTLVSVVIVPGVNQKQDLDISAVPNSVLCSTFLNTGSPEVVPFTQLPPDAPLFIMFSSGTTGPPKCLVHSVAGTLVQITKEHRLHCDLKREDVFTYYTTTGWMMWQWLVCGLHTGCTLLLYDGSPLHPHPTALWDLVDKYGVTVLGTGAKWLSVLDGLGVRPAISHSLDTLRCILSTGSPLSTASFRYVYEHVKGDLMLGSISGGTDIISCFVGCCPMLPVYEGEVQCTLLGMGVEVWGGEDGSTPIWDAPGELVCTVPFPSMPTHFLGDEEDKKYKKAYFERGPSAWRHGDHCLRRRDTGGVVMLGRSDATLNPSGVRFGSAEIYQIVETDPRIRDSVCVGQRRASDGEERVVLFVQLMEGQKLTLDLVGELKAAIRSGLSARHVPAVVLQVQHIPYTSSGKKVEVAVRAVIHGQSGTNVSAISNPEVLQDYAGRAELSGWADC